MPHRHTPPGAPSLINWPGLVFIAERLGVPVLRQDWHGAWHVIRTVAQLRHEWGDGDNETKTTKGLTSSDR